MAEPVKRIVVTGANGSGKTYFANRLARCVPTAELVSFDALKLTENWQQKSRFDIERDLAAVVAKDSWILEGGPSLLEQALDRADVVIWLDPPLWLRAVRLLLRPWKYRGQTRPELPDGNIDWPIRQYRFAAQSLWRSKAFHHEISAALSNYPPHRIKVCRNAVDLDKTVKQVSCPKQIGPL